MSDKDIKPEQDIEATNATVEILSDHAEVWGAVIVYHNSAHWTMAGMFLNKIDAEQCLATYTGKIKYRRLVRMILPRIIAGSL